MTAFLPARAHTRQDRARSTPIRRRVAALVATAVVAAALAWPDRSELGHTTITGKTRQLPASQYPRAR
jgi:hypothetical protein